MLFASAEVASARIVTGVTATASSEIDLSVFGDFPRSPMSAVDGAGLNEGDLSAMTADQRHLSNNGDFINWLSSHEAFGGVDFAPWFLVDLGAVYDIAGVRIFNYGEHGAAFDQSGLGVRHTDILISVDGVDFVPLATNFEIAQAYVPFQGEYYDSGIYYTISDFTGDEQTEASFRYMRFDIFSNWYGNNVAYGLAELQFEEIPLPGDFNNDGHVDAADYTVWRNNLNGDEAVLWGSGDGSGIVDIGDYELWKLHYGQTPPGSLLVSTPVPEPATAVLTLVLFGTGGALSATRRRRQGRCRIL